MEFDSEMVELPNGKAAHATLMRLLRKRGLTGWERGCRAELRGSGVPAPPTSLEPAPDPPLPPRDSLASASGFRCHGGLSAAPAAAAARPSLRSRSRCPAAGM